MNMIQMLGIVTFFYFFSLTLICIYKDKLNVKIMNTVFIIADIAFYFCWCYASHQTRAHGLTAPMTLENISPLMCVVIPATLIMGERLKKFAYSAISFLCFGMFVAMLFSPSHTYLFSFNHEASFWYTSEALCHMNCSLFGIYLVLSGQVKADFSHWIKSIVFMFSIITYGVGLNLIFERRYFGMDPDSFSIYMIDIFTSFETTLLAYYLGVFLVLTIGMQICYGINRLSKSKSLPEIQKSATNAVSDINYEETNEQLK